MATEAAATEAGAGRATLTIDLAAIQANWRRLREEVRGAEIAAVVKADAYGLGAAEVGPALRDVGCRRFFVAQLAEGLELRRALAPAQAAQSARAEQDLRIYLLNGLPADAADEVIEAGLVPVLNQPGEVEACAREARKRQVRLPAVLQVDTGMCRLGMAPHEVRTLDRRSLEALEVELVMSHLACAEEALNPMNEAQRRRFDGLRRDLPAAPASLANSSGIFLGAQYHYDLCRPGVALYGVNPTPGHRNPMAPVVTLEAPVLQVHAVREAGSVGYGATCTTTPGMRIATVPVGYADGYLRSAGGRGRARIRGIEVPLAGRVSMDLITLDVSALPAGAVVPGSPVELIFGPDGVDEVAAAAGTIGYEVLTRLGRRFARRYIRAAATA